MIRLEPCCVRVRHVRADDRAAAPQSFSVYIGILFAHTGLRERADDTPRTASGRGASKR
jgi:hypothetical protein